MWAQTRNISLRQFSRPQQSTRLESAVQPSTATFAIESSSASFCTSWVHKVSKKFRRAEISTKALICHIKLTCCSRYRKRYEQLLVRATLKNSVRNKRFNSHASHRQRKAAKEKLWKCEKFEAEAKLILTNRIKSPSMHRNESALDCEINQWLEKLQILFSRWPHLEPAPRRHFFIAH